MAQDLDKIMQTKKAAEADLLNRPGVIGVDVGYRYVGGNKTDEIVIRVHVAEKKDVSPDQKIPETINGVKTDVLQNRVAPVADDSYYNPVLGGIGIGPGKSLEPWAVGTLGAIVVDKSSDKRMLLTNYHVVCLNDDWKKVFGGKDVFQPYKGNILSSRWIADIERAELGDQCDAAVASIKPDRLVMGSKYQYLIQDIGPVIGVPDPTLPNHGLRIGLPVRKRGRTTGLTFGYVDSFDYTGKFTYKYGVGDVTLRNQFTINADKKRNSRFVDAGDSGSVIVNEANQVIGLLHAGNGEGLFRAGTVGYATPINIVLDKMGVRMGAVAPNQVLIGDVNADGKADLVWNWLGDKNLMLTGLAQANGIFKILPGGGFSELEERWSGYRAFIGDVDGDGRADLVWNSLGGDINRICVGLSQGDGNFGYAPQEHPVRGGWSGYQLLIGDVDGDRKADLVWNSLGGDINRICVGLSKGHGTFDFLPAQDHPAHPGSPRWGGFKVLIGDVDGDGKADLVWNSPAAPDIHTGTSIYVGFSQGNGKFQLSTLHELYLQMNIGGWTGYKPALIGDVNGDGKADLVWNYLGGDINRIYVGLSQGNNKPNSTFYVQTPQEHPVRGGWGNYQLLIGDVNGDGKADLVWNGFGDTNRIYVGLSQAKPDSYSTFDFLPAQDHPMRGGWGNYQLLIGDVNGDGKADLVWNELGGLNRFYVALGQGDGTFQFLPAQDRGGVSA